MGSAIGGASGSVGGVFGFFLIVLWVETGNVWYLGLLVPLFVGVLVVASLFSIKYINVELEAPVRIPERIETLTNNRL